MQIYLVQSRQPLLDGEKYIYIYLFILNKINV
jgi:hypothetical protein